MPLEIKDELLAELLKRQMDEQDMQERFAPRQAEPPVRPTDMDPKMLALLGGIADGATTYKFMRQGDGTEENALLSGRGPVTTGVGAALAGGVGATLLARALKNKVPQGVIDAILANLGATQTTLAAHGNSDSAETGFQAARRLLNVAKK